MGVEERSDTPPRFHITHLLLMHAWPATSLLLLLLPPARRARWQLEDSIIANLKVLLRDQLCCLLLILGPEDEGRRSERAR